MEEIIFLAIIRNQSTDGGTTFIGGESRTLRIEKARKTAFAKIQNPSEERAPIFIGAES